MHCEVTAGWTETFHVTINCRKLLWAVNTLMFAHDVVEVSTHWRCKLPLALCQLKYLVTRFMTRMRDTNILQTFSFIGDEVKFSKCIKLMFVSPKCLKFAIIVAKISC